MTMRRILAALVLVVGLLAVIPSTADTAAATATVPAHAVSSSTTLAICQFIRPQPTYGWIELTWQTFHYLDVHISKCAYQAIGLSIKTCGFLVWETSVVGHYDPVSSSAPWCW